LERAAAAAATTAKRFEELSEPSERASLLAACVNLLPLPEAQQLLLTAEPELSFDDGVRARIELARRLLDEPGDSGREQAILDLQGLLSHPDAPTAAWELLARAWESSGAAHKVAEALDAWLEREPRNRSVLDRALRLALAESDAERALAFYDRLAREHGAPEAELSTELCKLCLRAGKTARAVELLRIEAERERQPMRRAALLVEVAELMLSAGDHAAALSAAQEARNLDVGSAEAVLLLARIAILHGQRADALGLLTSHAEAKERRRGKPLARVLRLAADLRLESDELGEALPLLVEAHQLDKSDVDTALLLGLVAIDLDRLETAAAALRVLIAQRELGPREAGRARALNLAQGYFQLARIEQHHGKKINAKRMALRALEENPNLVPAQRLLSDLSLH
jgi:thioredoxin-like negative regulator of GroEL